MTLKTHPRPRAFGGVWLAFLAAGMQAVGAAPSTFHVRHWTSEDGLPANRIAALEQTRDGYLWVGTWFGLARFDGVRFVLFNKANTPALPVESISALAVDRGDGALWIGTPRGLVRFKDGRFEQLAGTDPPSGDGWSVSRLLACKDGGVWVQAAGRIARWPSGWTGWSELRLAAPEHVRALWETDDGALEAMTHRRLFRIGRDGTVVQREPPVGFPADSHWTSAWPGDSQGRLWLGTAGDLRRREGTEWKVIQTLPLRAFPGDVLVEDRTTALWAGHSGAGLWRHAGDSSESIPLGQRGAEKAVNCLLEDREGHMWAGTPQGLFQIRPSILQSITEEDGLPHRECWSVSAAPDGAVWAGTRRGLARIEAGRVTNVLWDEPHRSRASSILVDPEGGLWSGRKHNGIQRWRLGRETNQFLHLPGADATSGVDLGALYVDRHDRVWVGTSRGAVWFENGRPAVEFGAQGLPTSGIRAIFQMRDGTMWFGTWKAGVVRWQQAGHGLREEADSGNRVSRRASGVDLERLPAAAARFTTADGLADDRVFVFHEDAGGALWIGTHNGLSRFRDGRFFTFRTEQGLFDNLINWLEEDAFGRLWFSCNRGVFCMSRAELNEVADGRKPRAGAVVYGAADGMLNPETNGESAPAGCQTRDGRIWFPTMDGLVVIDPSAVRKDDPPPVVVIEEVRADGVEMEIRGQQSAGRIPRLAAGRARDVQIRFTANSFMDPRRNRFQYRLVNHDAGWRDETTERLAVYTNLRPGDYRFELRAANAHGLWSDAPAVFAFSLAPFFWQTWPFRVLCGLTALALAGVFSAYRLRWQRRLLTARHDRALAEERARIARDLHDDLGTALTGVALELDVARQQARDGLSARLADGATHLRALAERMREVVWAVNPACDTVSSLASFLEQQAGALLHAGGVRGRFEFPEELPPLPLDSNARHQLALAVREALTNVLRHARASEVTLAVACPPGALVVSVQDNGRGFDAAEPASFRGHGLRNLRTRLERVGGTAAVESIPGHGTRVEFRVPLARPPGSEEVP